MIESSEGSLQNTFENKTRKIEMQWSVLNLITFDLLWKLICLNLFFHCPTSRKRTRTYNMKGNSMVGGNLPFGTRFFFISTSKPIFSLSGAYSFANFSLKMVLRWCLVWPDMYCQVFLYIGVLNDAKSLALFIVYPSHQNVLNKELILLISYPPNTCYN